MRLDVRAQRCGAIFVGVGAFYSGPRWWPVVVELTVMAAAWKGIKAECLTNRTP